TKAQRFLPRARAVGGIPGPQLGGLSWVHASAIDALLWYYHAQSDWGSAHEPRAHIVDGPGTAATAPARTPATATRTWVVSTIVDAIVVDGLRKRYGDVQALDGVSFAVREGEVFGLLGPNGAGKSTTVRVLVTLTTPDDGRAAVAGHDVRREANAVRRTIGYVPQET